MAKCSLDKGYTEVQFLPLLYTLLTQLVECLPYKEEVVSSSLTGCIPFFGDLTHLVEYLLCKQEVASSNLAISIRTLFFKVLRIVTETVITAQIRTLLCPMDLWVRILHYPFHIY